MARSIDDIIATRQQDGTFGPRDPETASEGAQQEMRLEQTAETPEAKPDDQAEVAATQPPADAGGEQRQPQSQQPAEGSQPDGAIGSDPDLDPKNWTYAAYRDEKAKRQAAEKRAAEIEAALRQRDAFLAQQQQQPEPEPRPDLFADPDAYEAYRDAKEDARLRNLQANMSLEIAKVRHGEDRVTEAFNAVLDAAAKGDPRLAQIVVNAANPGETLLQVYDAYKKQQEIGDDLDGYIERKVQERLAAQQNGEDAAPLQQQQKGPQGAPAAMPSNMAGMRSVGARTGPVWTGPAPIEDLIAARQNQNRGR